MQQKSTKIISFILPLIVALLAGCARTTPTPPPELAPWAEQYAAAKGLVTDLGSEIVLVEVDAHPLREQAVPSRESIELDVSLVFKSLEQIEGDHGRTYNTDIVTYNDHRLDATIHHMGIATNINIPDPAAIDREAMVQIGAQEALQATIIEGEAYMEEPVDFGNTWIDVVWDLSVDHPEFSDILSPVWEVTYFLESLIWLDCWVDAQTGEVLGCAESS